MNLLKDCSVGLNNPDNIDPFPNLWIISNLEGCKLPFLTVESVAVGLDSASGKAFYKSCIKSFNKSF